MTDKRDLEIGSAKTAVRPAGSDVVAAGPFQPPAAIGRYRLERLLGRGGMAAVYQAVEQGSDRRVALKLMDPNLRGDPTFVERFLNEAKASSRLHHPNVVEMLEHGEHEGWYFIASELVDGGTVAGLLAHMGFMPPAVAAELFAQLLAGLAYAHDQGLIHRDLKPENLLLTSGGLLKIGDFGIARSVDHQKLTKTGMLVGTAGYMSPEQARGDDIDQRSDLFTAGIILFELLSGRNPFEAENAAVSLTRILKLELPSLFEVSPTVPPELEQLVDRLLTATPQERIQTASDALTLLLPLVAARRRDEPAMLAECLKRPADMKRRLDSQAAARLLNEAQALMTGGQLEQNRAAFKLYSARLLDPSSEPAKAAFDQACQQMGLQFGVGTNPKILELEATLEKAPNAPAPLQQLAQLYKLEGNLFKSAIYVKRYLRLRPGDSYAANQLFQLTGERLNAPTAALAVGESTRELMAGVKTGGFKAQGRVRPSAPTRQMGSAPAGQLTVTEVETKSPLAAALRKWVPIVVVLVVAGLLMRKLFRFIEDATNDTDRATVSLRDGLEGRLPPPKPAVAPEVPEPAFVSPVIQPPAQPQPPPPVDPDTKVSVELAYEDARAKFQRGAFDEAIARIDAAMTAQPQGPNTHRLQLLRAKALLALKRNSDASDTLDGLMASATPGPVTTEALLRRAQAKLQNLADEEALADFAAFFAATPSDALMAEGLVARGELYLRQNKRDEALSDFTAAQAKAPPNDNELRARIDRGFAALK